jgi:hypothetical protein
MLYNEIHKTNATEDRQRRSGPEHVAHRHAMAQNRNQNEEYGMFE